MNGKRALIISLAMFFVAHLFYYYPSLPEKMATHFNHRGEPDGWMSKNSFFVLEIVLLSFIGGLFYGISYLTAKMPDGLINLPNKEYWLAPARRETTLQTIRSAMETFQIPLLLLFIALNQLTFHANLRKENLSSLSWLIVGGFLVFTLIWSINFYRKFKIYENRTS